MICIYHSRDLDGWMSAAIVKLWHHKTEPINPVTGMIEPLKLIGWDYGNPIPSNLKDNMLVMADISFPQPEMFMLWRTYKESFIWIDHHASAIRDNTEINVGKVIFKGLTDVKFSACELTWKYFFPNEPMPEVVRLLGRYDCFGHKGTEEEQKVLEFQYAARAYLENVNDCYDKLCQNQSKVVSLLSEIGGGIYTYLCSEARADYKNVFPITLSGYKVAAINKQRFNAINFGIDYHNDGYDAFLCFHYANGKWNFSLYNDNGKVDCSVICKEFGGGGHSGAAGMILNDEDFNNFMKL